MGIEVGWGRMTVKRLGWDNGMVRRRTRNFRMQRTTFAALPGTRGTCNRRGNGSYRKDRVRKDGKIIAFTIQNVPDDRGTRLQDRNGFSRKIVTSTIKEVVRTPEG